MLGRRLQRRINFATTGIVVVLPGERQADVRQGFGFIAPSERDRLDLNWLSVAAVLLENGVLLGSRSSHSECGDSGADGLTDVAMWNEKGTRVPQKCRAVNVNPVAQQAFAVVPRSGRLRGGSG